MNRIAHQQSFGYREEAGPTGPDVRARPSETRLSGFFDRGGGPRRPPARSSGYSRFVRGMKFVLPAAAVVLIALVVIWPQFDWSGSRSDPSDWKIEPEAAENLSMTEPRYVGTDGHDRPFTVSAESARQIAPEAQRIALDSPKGDITLSNGGWVAVKAEEGVLDRETFVLDLSGGVELLHDDGYVLNSRSARVDLKAGTASGEEPVEGHGPAGSISGEGFRVLDNGSTIVLTGKSSMRILPDMLSRE